MDAPLADAAAAGSGMMPTVYSLVLGMTAGAMLVMAIALRRAPTALQRLAGVAFSVGVAAYAVMLWHEFTGVIGPVAAVPIHMIALTAVTWFWIFVMALFCDLKRPSPWIFTPLPLFASAALADLFVPCPIMTWIWLGVTVGQIGLILHAIFVILRSWKGDLVETRRKVRGPFFVSVAVYTLVTRAFEPMHSFNIAPDWYPLANAVCLAVICIAGSFVFTDTRDDLFGASPASDPVTLLPASGDQPAGEAIDRATRADLDRLECLMKTEEVWREEGLAIAGLATRVGLSETALRHLINDCLGYRNFPTYINAHRIAAAKARLSDPHEARTPVSAIAFDLGFASLAPFNRAFREETGLSPSEWRRRELSADSSIPETV